MKRIAFIIAVLAALAAGCSVPQLEDPENVTAPVPTPPPSDGIETLTVKEFRSKLEDSNTWYRLNLEIISIVDNNTGTLYAWDASGFLYFPALAPGKDGDPTQFGDLKLKAGDQTTILAHRGSDHGLVAAKDAYLERSINGIYAGAAEKKTDYGWLELPATENNDANSVFLIHRDGRSSTVRSYSINYDKKARLAKWVCYPYVFGQGDSDNCGEPYAFDPLVAYGDQAFIAKEYVDNVIDGLSYVRGQMVPFGVRSGKSCYDLYLATNFCPMHPRAKSSYVNKSGGRSGGAWDYLEHDLMLKSWAEKCDTLYVVTGAVSKGSTHKVKDAEGKYITVPVAFYQAVLAHSKDGKYRALGAYFENKENSAARFGKDDAMSIDALETRTGENFFCNLPSVIERDIESADPNKDSWWWN